MKNGCVSVCIRAGGKLPVFISQMPGQGNVPKYALLGLSSGYFGFFSDHVFLAVHARHVARNLQHSVYFGGSSMFDCRLISCTIFKIRMDFVGCVIVQSTSAQFVREYAMVSDEKICVLMGIRAGCKDPAFIDETPREETCWKHRLLALAAVILVGGKITGEFEPFRSPLQLPYSLSDQVLFTLLKFRFLYWLNPKQWMAHAELALDEAQLKHFQPS